ncbi:MAG: phosphoheptose isomerase [Chitinophagaceae bacterium]|nr:phosphoheptose isomerase [Chitinophagaceae bacterium]
MNLYFPASSDKKTVFSAIEKYISDQQFIIVNKDENRPWGGFYVIDEAQAGFFIETWFKNVYDPLPRLQEMVSPKILVVAPGKRLSWQYHHRRSERWKVIGGYAGVVQSFTDDETEIKNYHEGDVIRLQKGERHRLVGLDAWGIIAEIWEHTDSNNPSNEDDIIRLQDDFGR